VEEEVDQDQDDRRDTQNPRQEIFTHDVLLSMVCSDDDSMMPSGSSPVCAPMHNQYLITLLVALPRRADQNGGAVQAFVIAASLQGVASDQLAAEAVPEPGMAVMFGTPDGVGAQAQADEGMKGGSPPIP
jgi:hypothetical protein